MPEPLPAGSVVLAVGVVDLVVDTFGLWCSRCLKPSAVRVRLLQLGGSGITEIGTMVTCEDESTHA